MNNEQNTQLENGMTRETLIFAVACILDGALDIIQQGMPDSVSADDRRSYSDRSLIEMSEWERGAVDGAIAAVSIIVAQSINDGIGNGDTDEMLGDFSAACSKYIASNWSNQGDTLRYRIKRKVETSPNGWHFSEVYLDYPDAGKMATRLVTELGIE